MINIRKATHMTLIGLKKTRCARNPICYMSPNLTTKSYLTGAKERVESVDVIF